MTRTYAKTKDIAHLERLIKDLTLSPSQIAEIFGVTSSTVNHWLRHGEAPKWTLIAAEGIHRRCRGTPRRQILLVHVPTEHIKTVETVVGSLGGSARALNLTELLTERT